MKQRIQKLLSRHQVGSRRVIEDLIRQGRVCVNKQAAILGQKVDETDLIEIDQQPVQWKKNDSTVVLVFNKAEGVLCSRKKFNVKQVTVFEHLPEAHRSLNLVGRLDVNSGGLILLTNDGDLLYRLTHPKYNVSRIYLVRVYGHVNEMCLNEMRKGVVVDDELLRIRFIEPLPKANNDATNHWFRMSLSEGKNREIRRIWGYFGCEVSRLVRISYGCVHLPKSLQRNAFESLTEQEIIKLKKMVDLA